MVNATEKLIWTGGKQQHEASFSEALNERVFIYKVGPFNKSSVNVSKYLVSGVDDNTGDSMAKFLKSGEEPAFAVKKMFLEIEYLYEKRARNITVSTTDNVTWFQSDARGV